MKDQILKIAKVKSEKEFYKKYPTEEAFMAKHGKALKKAAMGTAMVDTQLDQLTNFTDYNDMPQGKSGIHINPANKGKFTATKKKTGKSTEELTHSSNPLTRKRAIFAQNAKKWKHADNGWSNVANALGGFTNPGKAATGTTPAVPASGGLGDALQGMFGGDPSAFAKDNPNGALGAGGQGLGAGAKQAGIGLLNAAPQILEGIGQMGEQKKAIKKADQMSQISGVTAQAAESRDISKPKNQYVRPEDQMIQGLNPQGAGTNFLAAYGARIGGNPTEIQNTYNPGNLYSDLGYEPLNDSNVKQFQKGGKLISRDKINIDSYGNQGTAFRDIFQNPNMTQDTTYAYDSPSAMLRYNTNGGNPNAYVGGRGGFTSAQPDSLAKYKQLLSSPFNSNDSGGIKRLASGNYENGGDLPTAEFGDYFQNSGQASVGKGAGSAIGSAFFGPVGGMVGGFLGGVAGNLLGGADDANKLANFQSTTKQNTERAALQQGAQAMQAQNKSFMEDGGWVSNEWQPQVIASFGEHKVKDLLKPPYDADMLRSGGHLAQVNYTPPSAEAMFTGRRDMPYQMENGGYMAMGGDLEVHRGKAEPISYNPFLQDGGETVMFKGPSHDNGGMPISSGNNGVEVEGGEPAVKLADGGSPDGNLVVFGNMKIDDMAANHIGVEASKGKKYKSFINDLSKFESKQNNVVKKGT